MDRVEWKLHLSSSANIVFNHISTKEGIEKFWAEEVSIEDDQIHFIFPSGRCYSGQILKVVSNKEFHLKYFDSYVKFIIVPSLNGGTELTLINENVPDIEFIEVYAGWISVLLNLKATVDFHIDLRNHDADRSWSQKYVDN